MKWYRVDNFFDTWRPVYRMLRLFSLATMTYNFRDQTAERTSADQTMFVVGLLMPLLTLYHTFTYFQSRMMSYTNSHIISAGRFGSLLLIISAHALTVISYYVYGYKISQFPKNIQNIDQQMAKLFKYSWNYQSEHFRTILFLILTFLVWIVIARISAYNAPLSDLNWINTLSVGLSFAWLNVGYQTKTIGILIMLSVIRKRYAVLNEQMLKMSDDLGTTTNPEQLRMKITKISILYGQLSDVVDQFNSCHSTTVMFVVATAFGLAVFSTFAMIHAFAANVDDSLFRLVWSNLVFDLFLISMVLYILVYSVLVNSACRQSAVTVHKVISYRLYDRRICQQLRKMSQHMEHHKPKMSCGLFDFDAELIYTIIGSLSTYLLILVQFDLVNYSQF